MYCCDYCLYREILNKDGIMGSLLPNSLTLSDWIGIIGGVATLAMAAATVYMAYATRKMASVTRETLEAQNKPHIVVYTYISDDSSQHFKIVIENIGSAPGYDIRFEISDNLKKDAEGISKLDREPKEFDSGALATGIPYLVPKQKRILNWGQYGGILETLGGKPASITVMYKNSANIEQPPTKNILDVKDYLCNACDASNESKQTAYLEQMSGNLSSINKTLVQKMKSETPLDLYMYVYFAYKSNAITSADLRCIEHRYGLTEEQINYARSEACRLFGEETPDLCSRGGE